MKYTGKKIVTVVCCFFVVGAAFTGLFAQTAGKSKILGFSAMAEKIEKSHGTLLELDLELSRGSPVYQAKVVLNGERVSLYFDAVTGNEIRRKSVEVLDAEDRQLYNFITGSAAPAPLVSGASKNTAGAQSGTIITMERAREIALARTGGGQIREINLDYEHGMQIYEIEVRYNNVDYEVDINAVSGEIIKFKTDW